MPTRLGDLQLAIMRVLWASSEASAAQVHRSLYPQRALALTTIATMLRKMETKGVVNHRRDGRQFLYRPTIAEGEVHRSMVGDLVDRLFATELPGHDVHGRPTILRLTPEELARRFGRS